MTDAAAQIAARIYATYRNAALRQISRSIWSRNDAAERLRPWAAVTLLCGSNVPGLPSELEQAERDLLAEEMASPAQWKPVLARARAEAGARADQLRDGTDAEAFTRAMATWRDFDTLARFLGVPLRMLCEAQAAASTSERIAA